MYLAVDIKDAADVSVTLEAESLEFAAKGGDDGAAYAFTLTFFAPIKRESSKWSTKRRPEFLLRKDAEETWPKLQKEGKLPWVKVDWQKWVESDEEDEKGGFDDSGMDGMDFSAVTAEDAAGSDDDDDILADLDEDIAIETDEEEVAQAAGGEAMPTPSGAPEPTGPPPREG